MRALVVLCCLLGGCVNAPEVMQSVQSNYVGQKADNFFLAKGPPARQYRLSDGGMIYTWAGGHGSYTLPSTTTVSMTPTYGGGVTGTARTSPGGTLDIGCTLELHADKQGVVRSIRVAEDTIGRWNLSRCAEVLSN